MGSLRWQPATCQANANANASDWGDAIMDAAFGAEDLFRELVGDVLLNDRPRRHRGAFDQPADERLSWFVQRPMGRS